MSIPERKGLGGRRVGTSLLPTFLIIGAMKAGTTSLYEYLRVHPEVFMPDMKEPDYFSKGVLRGAGLEWYSKLFEEADGARAIGERSTDYAKFPTYGDVPARIAEVLPEVQLIYAVRHPIERMRSQYVHRIAHGKETRPIEEALLTDPQYLDYSRYAFQIQQYLPRFDRKQILVITSESLRHARKATLGRVFEFLGLKPTWWSRVLDSEFHQSRRPNALNKRLKPVRQLSVYRAMASKAPLFMKTLNRRVMTKGIHPSTTVISDGLRRQLEGLVRGDVRDLCLLVGDDFDGWGLI